MDPRSNPRGGQTPAACDDLRCLVYQHVASLFDDVPDVLPAPVDEDPREPPMRSARETHPRTLDAIEALRQTFLAHPRVGIETEQVRLFVNAPGGVAAPPYASWYLDGRLIGPACEWAAGEYRGESLDVAADAGEPADFIATELEYLYFLCRHERAARLTADRAALDRVVRAQARFLHEHLLRWMPAFLRRLRAAAPHPVFARVADLLDVFCEEEARYLV